MKNRDQKPSYEDLMKQLEHYKEIETQLNLIMDQCFDLIAIIDKNGMPIKVSKSCSKLFGFSHEEIVNTPVQKLESKGILNKSVTVEVLRDRKRRSLIQDTHAGRRLMVTGIPMFNESNEFVGVLNISQDITEIERLNKRLDETQTILDWYRDEVRKKQIIDKEMIIGKSEVMKNVIDTVKQVVNFETTVLLQGETGVGKGLLAKTIHQMSYRSNEPFIQVNCGAIPENLLESELFGYEKGAFTGASKQGKKGLFETANNGTIFLDEIGEMPLHLQVKLLNVIQEKEIYRIGGNKPIKIDVRIISATNRDLKNQVEEGTFREDLFYRLNVLPIYIPPLRERYEDLPVFINTFLDKYNRKYNVSRVLDSSAYSALESYHWPGNIRELENTIERLTITCNENIIKDSNVLKIIKPHKQTKYNINKIMPLKEAKEELEKELILLALKKYKTTRKVGEALDIDQSTVVKKMKKLKIKNC